MYFFVFLSRDNLNSDIAAANLYRRYVDSQRSVENPQTAHTTQKQWKIPKSRQLPSNYPLLPQTVTRVKGVLVRTGVYRDSVEISDHRHKDFDFDETEGLHDPAVTVDTVLDAVEYILKEEGCL